jgi:ATP-dependent RNA helicase SUPV3L1/SUV3
MPLFPGWISARVPAKALRKRDALCVLRPPARWSSTDSARRHARIDHVSPRKGAAAELHTHKSALDALFTGQKVMSFGREDGKKQSAGQARPYHAVEASLKSLDIELRSLETYKTLKVSEKDFDGMFEAFQAEIVDGFQKVIDKRSSMETDLVKILNEAYYGQGPYSLLFLLKLEFFKHVMRTIFTPEQLAHQETLVDFRYPQEWFPYARRQRRNVHLHVGPTNSGKTYQALKRLERVDGLGTYLGPLRLLAQEIYMRMNKRGVPTFLITGDERQPPLAEFDEKTKDRILSCTVEMANLRNEYDVAVIDEIQMIADDERGFAWTIAFLGLIAKEVHLCGEERAVPIIERLTKSLGDNLEIHRYNRLSPLEVSKESLGDIRNLQKGDCIVCFSVRELHALRNHISRVMKKKVAIVYGKLPSEIRLQQAELFNDPNNDYDFLVASNAIGMGLNLAIKRVIFWSTVRPGSNGHNLELEVSETRQIGGRAGRYRTSAQDTATFSIVPVDASQPVDTVPETNVGYVMAMTEPDLDIIRNSMASEPETIDAAGVYPTNDMIERFYTIFPPGFPFSFVLVRMMDLGVISSSFFLTNIRKMVDLAHPIDHIKGLDLSDRITMCTAPHNPRTPEQRAFFIELAQAVATGKGGDLLSIKGINLDVLDLPTVGSKALLQALEELHRSLVLYKWLSFRFPNVFISRPMAEQAKNLAFEAIQAVLDALDDSGKLLRRTKMKAKGSGEEQEVRLRLRNVEPSNQAEQDRLIRPRSSTSRPFNLQSVFVPDLQPSNLSKHGGLARTVSGVNVGTDYDRSKEGGSDRLDAFKFRRKDELKGSRTNKEKLGKRQKEMERKNEEVVQEALRKRDMSRAVDLLMGLEGPVPGTENDVADLRSESEKMFKEVERNEIEKAESSR